MCGAISHYNEQGEYSKVVDILPLCVFKVTHNYPYQQQIHVDFEACHFSNLKGSNKEYGRAGRKRDSNRTCMI